MNVLSRLLGVLAVLALLFQFPLTARPAAAQAGGFLVQYEGTLTLSDAPAAAGTVIHAVAAQTSSDMTDCGQAQVGTQGHYTLQITSRDCITPDMNHRQSTITSWSTARMSATLSPVCG
jgi:hypothetical protein